MTVVQNYVRQAVTKLTASCLLRYLITGSNLFTRVHIHMNLKADGQRLSPELCEVLINNFNHGLYQIKTVTIS